MLNGKGKSRAIALSRSQHAGDGLRFVLIVQPTIVRVKRGEFTSSRLRCWRMPVIIGRDACGQARLCHRAAVGSGESEAPPGQARWGPTRRRPWVAGNLRLHRGKPGGGRRGGGRG